VVVVQGTDTIEEVAFGLDLLVRTPKPVVVVGAMHSSDSLIYDGSRNLADAIAAACMGNRQDIGVVVVMAGQVHGADDVVKRHSTSEDAFCSPNSGALGRVRDMRTVMGRVRAQRPPTLGTTTALPVDLIVSTVGLTPEESGRLAQASVYGVVIAAMGSGNTPAHLLQSLGARMDDGLPVVLASRCISGGVVPMYAFPGGGAAWRKRGAVLAGSLSYSKARVALSLALGDPAWKGRLHQFFGLLTGELGHPRAVE
jgi:L-asparaginase